MPNEPAEPLEPGTPLPWSLKHRTAIYCEGYYVADTAGCNVPEHITVKDVANAAYIVEACNNYLAIRAELAAEREKVERLEAENEELRGMMSDANQAFDAYGEKHERVRGLLREVEWDGEVTDREREWLCSACLFCDGIPTYVEKTTNMSHLHSGHKPDCPLAAALNPDGEK